MFAKQLIATSAVSSALVEPEPSIIDADRALQLFEQQAGYGQWKVIFPGSVLLSHKVAEIFGLRANDAPMPLPEMVEFYHPDDRGKLLALIAQALEGRRGFHCRLRIVRPDGSVRMTETMADLRIKEGRVTELFGVTRDATAEAEREAQALARVRLVADLIADMPAPVAMLDERLRVIECNRFWLRCHRMIDRKEAVGRGIFQLFPELGNDIRREYERALRGETIRTKRTLTNPSTNAQMHCSAVLAPWYASEERIGGVMSLVGWADFGVTRPTGITEEAADFDGSLLDLLKTVI